LEHMERGVATQRRRGPRGAARCSLLRKRKRRYETTSTFLSNFGARVRHSMNVNARQSVGARSRSASVPATLTTGCITTDLEGRVLNASNAQLHGNANGHLSRARPRLASVNGWHQRTMPHEPPLSATDCCERSSTQPAEDARPPLSIADVADLCTLTGGALQLCRSFFSQRTSPPVRACVEPVCCERDTFCLNYFSTKLVLNLQRGE